MAFDLNPIPHSQLCPHRHPDDSDADADDSDADDQPLIGFETDHA